MTIFSLLAAILLFGILVIGHEAGHFAAAKLCGVKVNEFSLGMGPLLWQKKKGETEYSWRALPIGGYCAMEGEDETSEDPRAFTSQTPWKRFLILFCGPAMNFLLGFLLVVVIYAGATGFYTAELTGFADGCPLQGENALQAGDRIVAVDGEHVYVRSDFTLLLSLNGDRETHDLVVRRGGQRVSLPALPFEIGTYQDMEGQDYQGYGLFFGVEEATLGAKLRMALNQTADYARLVRLSLKMMVTGQVGLKDMSGPVGIVSTITEVGQESENFRMALSNILLLGAMLSVNLGVMNLLPLPALDGGRIFFLLINAVTVLLFRRKIPARYEGYVHAAGLMILLGFMALITFSDIYKFFQ